MIALHHPEVIDVYRLKQALKHQNRLTLANVLDKINSGFYVLLRASESTLTIHPMADSIHIAQAAGKMSDIDEVIACVGSIAKEQGKKYITVKGRKGWNKVLKPFGFEPNEYYLRKKI